MFKPKYVNEPKYCTSVKKLFPSLCIDVFDSTLDPIDTGWNNQLKTVMTDSLVNLIINKDLFDKLYFHMSIRKKIKYTTNVKNSTYPFFDCLTYNIAKIQNWYIYKLSRFRVLKSRIDIVVSSDIVPHFFISINWGTSQTVCNQYI